MSEEPSLVEPPSDGEPFKVPPLEDLLKAIEGMDGISDADKQQLIDSLSKQDGLGGGFIPPQLQPDVQAGIAPDLVILLIFLTVISLIFVFFGYKLYKSLVERERRREEKRRQKQQKKKK